MNGRIRPGAWIAASAALAAAVAIARLAPTGYGGGSLWQPTRAASPLGGPALSAAPSIGVHPAAALLPSSARPAGARVDERREAAPRPEARIAGSSERIQPADSRAASDLRIVEAEAARRADALGLVDRAALAAARASARDSSATADDASRSAAADALLVDHLVQEAYRSTEFPIGFPAEERTRAAAESQVRALTPELRQGMLEVALQQDAGEERIGPRFDPYQIWEGSIP